jgi:hypothetical protein
MTKSVKFAKKVLAKKVNIKICDCRVTVCFFLNEEKIKENPRQKLKEVQRLALCCLRVCYSADVSVFPS